MSQCRLAGIILITIITTTNTTTTIIIITIILTVCQKGGVCKALQWLKGEDNHFHKKTVKGNVKVSESFIKI